METVMEIKDIFIAKKIYEAIYKFYDKNSNIVDKCYICNETKKLIDICENNKVSCKECLLQLKFKDYLYKEEYIYDDNDIEKHLKKIEEHINISNYSEYDKCIYNNSFENSVKYLNYIMSLKYTNSLIELNNLIKMDKCMCNKMKRIIFEYISLEFKKIINNNNMLNEEIKNILCELIIITNNNNVFGITFLELLLNIVSYIENHNKYNELYERINNCDTLKKENSIETNMKELIECIMIDDTNIKYAENIILFASEIVCQIRDKLEEKKMYSLILHKKWSIFFLYTKEWEFNSDYYNIDTIMAIIQMI
jgi:hypothetical protein